MMTTIKINLIALSILLSVICNAQLSGDTYAAASAKKSGKLTLVYNGVSGFIEENTKGEITGVLVDIIDEFEKYVKEQEGISLTHEFVYIEDGDFSVFMEKVRNSTGGVFGLSNVTINAERAKIYKFSPPYIDNVSLIVTNKSVATLNGIESIGASFQGMTALSVLASTYDERIQNIKENHYPSLEVKHMASGLHVMDELAVNSEVFGVLDLNYYLEALQKKMPIKRHSSCDVKDKPFGIIMPKSNDWEPLLKEFFNSGFIGSSRHSEIISSNLGSAALALLQNVKAQ